MDPTSRPPAQILGDLRVLIDELLNLDLADSADTDIAEVTVEVVRSAGRLDAAMFGLIGAADDRQVHRADRHRSVSAWLGVEAHRPVPWCRRQLRRARAMAAMADTAQELRAGTINTAHLDRLADAHSANPDAFADAEPLLVMLARTQRFDDFANDIATWVSLADPDGAEARALNRYHTRRAHLSATFDGTGTLDATFDPVSYATFAAALDRIEHDLWATDWATARDRYGHLATAEDLCRTPTQRRHDALIEMAVRATTAPATGRRPRPLITVVVDHPTLIGRVCELSNGTTITPGELLPLLCDADIERAVFDTPSRLLDIGTTRRLFTGATRRAVEIRDRRCQHPSCTTPAPACDVDHTIAHSTKGPTAHTNGHLLCPTHHPGRTTTNPHTNDTAHQIRLARTRAHQLAHQRQQHDQQQHDASAVPRGQSTGDDASPGVLGGADPPNATLSGGEHASRGSHEPEGPDGLSGGSG